MKARYQSLQLSTSKIEVKNTELVEGMQDLKEELNQVKEQNIELNKRIEQDEKLNDEADGPSNCSHHIIDPLNSHTWVRLTKTSRHCNEIKDTPKWT